MKPQSLVTRNLTTTSLAIANRFGKRHDNVLRMIERLQVPPGYHALNFKEMVRETRIGSGATREDRYYEVTRDGFVLLVMGFTGKAAMQWKIRFLDAFNAMEAELTGRPAPLPAPAPSPAPPALPAPTSAEQIAGAVPDGDVLTTAGAALARALRAKRAKRSDVALAHALIERAEALNYRPGPDAADWVLTRGDMEAFVRRAWFMWAQPGSPGGFGLCLLRVLEAAAGQHQTPHDDERKAIAP